jgi:hypothetical protein
MGHIPGKFNRTLGMELMRHIPGKFNRTLGMELMRHIPGKFNRTLGMELMSWSGERVNVLMLDAIIQLRYQML